LIDGWSLSSAGYKLWNFELAPDESAVGGKGWHLKLGIMRLHKPVLP